MSYITCNNLSLGYDGNIVSKNINFEVNKGDYLCIVGENGAGKSTLVKTLLQLIKPISGEMIKEDIKQYEIGYLPQQTDIQKDFPASVEEVVMSGMLSNCGRRLFYSREDKNKAKEMMKNMEIYDFRKRSYRRLSGGQQQRVLLARALCSTQKLVLLDEPVTGLDPKVTIELYNLINDINKKGTAIIMVSHDISAALEYASHILHIGKEQLFFGKKEDYIKSEAYKSFKSTGGMKHVG